MTWSESRLDMFNTLMSSENTSMDSFSISVPIDSFSRLQVRPAGEREGVDECIWLNSEEVLSLQQPSVVGKKLWKKIKLGY